MLSNTRAPSLQSFGLSHVPPSAACGRFPGHRQGSMLYLVFFAVRSISSCKVHWRQHTYMLLLSARHVPGIDVCTRTRTRDITSQSQEQNAIVVCRRVFFFRFVPIQPYTGSTRLRLTFLSCLNCCCCACVVYSYRTYRL